MWSASSGSVNTSKVGTYTLEYQYTDKAGNVSENTLTRYVMVVPENYLFCIGDGVCDPCVMPPPIPNQPMFTNANVANIGDTGNVVLNPCVIPVDAPPVVTLVGSERITLVQ